MTQLTTKIKRIFIEPTFIAKQINNGIFKKHPASLNFWSPNVFIKDSTLSCTKYIKISTQREGYNAIGLYAPPGEVITVTFDDDTFEYLKKTKWKGLYLTVNEGYSDLKTLIKLLQQMVWFQQDKQEFIQNLLLIQIIKH